MQNDQGENWTSDFSGNISYPLYERPLDQLTLQMFNSISIVESQFPTNAFFKKFFILAATDIDNILPFYHINAQFSLTVEFEGKSSSLRIFSDYSQNLICGSENIINGSENAVSFQKELFGGLFENRISSFHSDEIFPGIFISVFHGVFLASDGCVLGFDRTFTVWSESSFLITNDNIYIRLPTR